MPSTWTQNYYHAAFSTEDRVEMISHDLETRLYPFIGGILRERGCSLLGINGMPDHVHVLVRYPADLSRSDSRSSGWVHDTFPALSRFAWQNGYGGFTVSTSMVETVAAYIARQKEHHQSQDFKTEFLELLRKHDIEFDEAGVFE